MPKPQSLTIGEVADEGGVNVQTIRYYERRGLLPEPTRSASGYRTYSAEAVRRLRFIRRAQLLGFSLAEIEELLSLRMQPGTTCGDIRKRARDKISAVDQKIVELQRIKEALVSWRPLATAPGRQVTVQSLSRSNRKMTAETP